MNFKRLDEPLLQRIKLAVLLLALTPGAQLVVGALTDGLGANPIEKITHTTGYWTLALLMTSLAITPLRQLTGWSWLVRTRRMLGLLTFFYACLHFLTYLVLDQFFDWRTIVEDIAKRPYITVGFTAYLLLIPLAITSSDVMIKALGGKKWLQLHRLVYWIAAGGVIHFWWLVKKDISTPLNFTLVLLALLSFRGLHWLKNRQRAKGVAYLHRKIQE